LSFEFISLITEHFKLKPEEQVVLSKTMRSLSRSERRLFFQSLKPREREFKLFLTGEFSVLNATERNNWLNITVESILARGGEPDLADCLVMDLLGHFKVYHEVRQRSEREGVPLKAMTGFGGYGIVLALMIIVAVIIIYFFYR